MATINFDDTRASTWYEGYQSQNKGSFVDLSTLTAGTADYNAALSAVTENIIGLFEQKGITRSQAQASDAYKNMLATAKAGNTKDALQAAATAVTSAEAADEGGRGDIWGASVAEGGDINKGKSFFKIDPTTGKSTVSDDTTIQDLYTQGFGDTVGEIDAEGLQYWTERLAGTGGHGEAMTIQEIAQSFAESEEANIRDAYHEQYGRDVDDAGLAYWMGVSGAQDATQTSAGAYDATQLVKDSLKARGEHEQTETSIRDWGADKLGQMSNKDWRSDTYFTDMESTQVADWVKAIDQDKTMTLDDVKAKITERAEIMDAHNVFNVDDWDEDGAQPTGMGQFASLKEIQTHIDSGDSLYDLKKRLGAETWALLTHEKFKDPDDFKDFDFSKPINWNLGSTTPKPTDPSQGISPPDWRPTPTKPELPTPLPVDKRHIDYKPNVSSDVQDTSGYGQAKTQFDQAITAAAPDIRTAQGQAGERFTGTSAKGVRMKRSKASRMGTIGGTKRLGREQQTQSLNI